MAAQGAVIHDIIRQPRVSPEEVQLFDLGDLPATGSSADERDEERSCFSLHAVCLSGRWPCSWRIL